VVFLSSSIPVFSAKAIQISGTRTPSRSKHAISTKFPQQKILSALYANKLQSAIELGAKLKVIRL
jgi:hypothetical protein